MKRTLALSLATSLISLSAATPAVYASGRLTDKTPKVTFSGEGNVAFYNSNSSQQNTNNGLDRTAVGVEDIRVNIEAEGVTSEYGGLLFNYLMGITGKTNSGTNSIEESRIMIKGRFGRMMMGTTRPVADRMSFGTHTTQVASGGIVGNYSNVINVSTGVNRSVDLGGTAKDANKVNLISPRYKGFQLGVSFTPNSTRQGDEKPRSIVNNNTVLPFTKNNFEGALNYIHKCCNDVMLKMSLSGVIAKAKRGSNTTAAFSRHDAKSYAIGAVLEFKNFSWGAEFIDNGRSLARKDIVGQNAGQVYSTGFAYAYGRNTYSFGYLHSTRSLGQITYQNNTINPSAKAHVFNLAVERKVAPGLKVYAEGTRYSFQTHQAWVNQQNTTPQFNKDSGIGNSQGTVLMAGGKVTF